MTTEVDVVNRALQAMGTRTTVTSLAEQSNEAVQANLVLTRTRDELLRKAPWNCATNFNNLTYITSVPGTPENPTMINTSWAKGIPAPNWAYEYQYPVDCLRPLWVIPQTATGFSGGIPLTTALTGGAVNFWGGPPVKFKVSIDQFFPVISAAVVNGGTGYAIGDIITLASSQSSEPPVGAPVQLLVLSVAVDAVATVAVVNQIQGSNTPLGGSYFNQQINPVPQGSTTGDGEDATFNLTYGPKGDQRVILTNQENATLAFIKQVIDPNVMDPEFQQAWVSILGARLVYALTGDKGIANTLIQVANQFVIDARQADANEGLTINDVTPDWIRGRGIQYPAWEFSPNGQFDWGPLFTPY
ncbi:MAG TPA: hypothetical protein VLG09_04310 [Candidatus Saccharimonadales bacterium]|nr:hypothetical protein [Candidatus Saccharimonadales bacterium]